MIKITLEYATVEEAITAMATLKGTKTPAAPETKDKALGKSDGATDKKKSTEPDATGASTAKDKKADASQTPAAESKGPDTAAAYAEVAAKIAAAAKTHRTELVALLAKFGAKTGKDLKAEQYAEFSKELDGITAPADDLS